MNPHHKLQVSDIHHVVTILELIHKNNLSHLLFWSIYSEIGDNIFDFEQTIYRLVPVLSFLYQTSDEQTVCGAVVGLPVFPELLQTQRLPVQGPAAFLTHFQSSVTVLHTLIIFPLRI